MDSSSREFRQEVGKRIKDERERLKRDNGKPFRQEDFAELLGVSKQTVNYLENGLTDIKVDYLYKISEKCGCDIGYLLGECENRTYVTTDICKATGLEETAIELLTDNSLGNRKNCLDAKEYKQRIINRLIMDFKDESGLMANVFLCLRDKDEIEKYKSNKWYSIIIGIIDDMGIDQDKGNVLGFPFTLNDTMESMASYIDDVLKVEGHTEEEIEEIRKDTDAYFFDYRAKKISLEMVKAALQIKFTEYIDKYLF